MFCKYCGKPIDEGTMRCRICGRPVGPLEGGNGFWDLTGDEPAQPAAPQAADKEELQQLREQVEALRTQVGEVKKQPAREKQPGREKRALPVIAALLAVLALALGAFTLYMMWGLTGKLTAAEAELNRQETALTAMETRLKESLDAQSGITVGQDRAAAGESKWIGLNELAEIALYPQSSLFDGPKKGENDERGQSIVLGYPENGYDTTPIFTSRFIGPPGTYKYYWVRVETDETTGETIFTPLRTDEGYGFKEPLPSDADQTFILSIQGEVKEEQLGRYAFVVVDTQTRAAYVSGVVELYDRAEKNAVIYNENENGN